MDQLQTQGRSPRRLRKTVLEARSGWDTCPPSVSSADFQVKAVGGEGMDEDDDGTVSLEEAFHHHCQELVPESSAMHIDNVIELLRACDVLDSWFSPARVHAFLLTLQGSCNPGKQLPQPIPSTCKTLEYCHFEALLSWAAHVKGVELRNLVERVVSLARKVKHGSKKEKLQMVFDIFAKKKHNHMLWGEFMTLGQKLGIFKGAFGVADAYLLFKEHQCESKGATFRQFISILDMVSKLTAIPGSIFFENVCGILERLGDDSVDDSLSRLRLNIKIAATSEAGRDWNALMDSFDSDHSGKLSWDEFYDFCRRCLKLSDKTSHLRLVFELLDEDQSDEITLQELVHFVERNALPKERPLKPRAKVNTAGPEALER